MNFPTNLLKLECINFNVEITTNSASSAFWYQGSTHSHELTQLAGGAEVQSTERQVLWPLRQKEFDSNHLNGSNVCSSMVTPEGIWPTSPHLNVSLNLFRETTDDYKNSAARTILNVFSSGPSDSLSNDQAGKMKKSGTSMGCRLFGFDLKRNSNIAAAPAKEGVDSTFDSNCVKGSIPAASDSDKAQNSEFSKSLKELEQVTAEALPKETPNKQGSATSTRTRTKVKIVSYFWLMFALFSSSDYNN